MRRRMILVLIAAAALVAAGCGDDDGDDGATGAGETTETTEEMAEDEETGDGDVAMSPATLDLEDQSGDGTTVVVAGVSLPSDGFIAIHADADGSPGPVVGHSELLEAGDSSDVEVTLDEPLTESATLWPMAHIDTNGNGTYDFDPPDSTEDGPATFDDGEVAVAPLEYTLEGGEASGAAGAVTISGFVFEPDTVEVAVGDTVTWTNEDSVDHTVTAEGGAFSEPIGGGDEVSVTFDEAGTYEYFCGIHPDMTGEVVVS